MGLLRLKMQGSTFDIYDLFHAKTNVGDIWRDEFPKRPNLSCIP